MILAAAVLTSLSALGGEACRRAAQETADAKDRAGSFVVHEWGTFTSFAGSDGIQLEFRTRLGEDLPDFVYDRARQARESVEMRSAVSSQKELMESMVRMETPVIYFYTDRPRNVSVDVGFQGGLITEFFPPASAMSPPYRQGEGVPNSSSLGWKNLWLLPEKDDPSLLARIPATAGETHYGYARETDSAIVRFVDNHFGDRYEKFLFYRGVGNIGPGVKARALGGGRIRVESAGVTQGAAFLVEVRGGNVRFARLERLANGAVAELPAAVATGESLAESMVQALLAAGLYEKEARAMVRTWSDSWFEEEGLRVFYFVSERFVQDCILPLRIEPAPDKLVRVLVGRLELLTPENEAELKLLVERRKSGSLDEPTLRAEAERRFGRFAEAALASLGKR